MALAQCEQTISDTRFNKRLHELPHTLEGGTGRNKTGAVESKNEIHT